MITAAIFVSLLFVYALLSERASQTPITAPLLFTAAGMVMSPFWMQIAAAGMTANVFLRLAELGLVRTVTSWNARRA
jgi:sodium/hydrogen antiporter